MTARSRRPRTLGELLPGVAADLASRITRHRGATMNDDLIAALLEEAGDALYGHPQVRWVLEDDGRQKVVLQDGREFELQLVPVDAPTAS